MQRILHTITHTELMHTTELFFHRDSLVKHPSKKYFFLAQRLDLGTCFHRVLHGFSTTVPDIWLVLRSQSWISITEDPEESQLQWLETIASYRSGLCNAPCMWSLTEHEIAPTKMYAPCMSSWRQNTKLLPPRCRPVLRLGAFPYLCRASYYKNYRSNYKN